MYVLVFVSKHDEDIYVLGKFETYEQAKNKMDEDVSETVDGWEDVPIEDVYLEKDNCSAKAEYDDECFLWRILELR